MTISQDVVIRALNDYCFNTIWNEPANEYGVNLELYPQSPRFMINTIIGSRSQLQLPVLGQQYGVFWVDYEAFGGSLIMPRNTWQATDVIGNTYDTLFHVYSGTGLILPKAAVFLYHDARAARVYVAIKKAPLLAVVGIAAWSSLYLSVYRYTRASPTPITIQSFTVPSPDIGMVVTNQVNIAIIDARAISANGTFVYVNGYDLSASTTVSFVPGDYVDIYIDRTVIGIYTVDLSTTVTGYFSTKYSCYKEILHCPKAVNPTNRIMTSELLTLTARRNTDHVGAFIHRNDLNGLTQITHNDVGLSTEVVNAYRTSLGSQDLSIEVKLRAHANTLIRDASYIDYLYICDDATIMSFLLGTNDPSLPFWIAAALEQTAYVGYMFSTPTLISPATLTNYVAGLGYYTVLSVLCRHMSNYIIDSLPVNGISVRKPLILSGLASYPLVYLNGRKVRATQIDYKNGYQNNVIIALTSEPWVEVGQTLSVELIESGSSTPYLFTPSSGTPAITLPFMGVSVYEVNTLTTPVIGYQTTASKSYTPVAVQVGGEVQSVAVTGGTQVIFTSAAYGKQYLIQNGVFSCCYGVDISSQVTAIMPVQTVLTTLCTDETTVVPLLGYQSLDVFLNGRRLIEGIDFSAHPLCDPNGNPAIVQVMICNREFLCLTGGSNYLEVVAHTSVRLNQEIGYVANNIIDITNDVDLWYNNMSDAVVNGDLLLNPTDQGNTLIPQLSINNGTPFMVLSEVPSIVSAALSGYSSTADDQRIGVINTYFNQQPTVNDVSTLIIPHSWQVYSPYLAAIVYDAIQAGEITLFNTDPDNTLFEQQFASYNYLLANDPTMTASISKIDLRYCDIFPTYATVTVPDINTYNALHRLASLMLPPDSDTLGEILDG